MKEETFFLVREDVLPEAMRKTLEVKKLIERKKADSVADAVQRVDMSRSAYYKYRDAVFPFHTMVNERIITLFFHLEDRSGTLSQLLAVVATAGCNVLTIHQTIPLQGRANVTLSLNTNGMKEDINSVMAKLKRLEFVEKVEILGSGA
ncbi:MULTISPECIES: ACT domain-containing protein [Metabacillus]|jgi:chorismate mutase|uniref:ACT domain-containing protein n=1 Tax=Metabacillus hrfriensis TaxID=3048891 RepID=A0ACD4R8A3_9BACI|nr:MULTISPECIES: ACT domain-containing protein [Metabacillus]UAL51176.1 ACT domain-containing protein [Metabacillus dongyingensis]USK27470.1 ACT domain-containing protein [Bacillus sp. CMF21]WHZ56682.1 ACT domain-containing protein [Metabacillus sp. CT-WN-B3]